MEEFALNNNTCSDISAVQNDEKSGSFALNRGNKNGPSDLLQDPQS